MHKATFYPLGNADCCLIELTGGKKLLFDYANMRDPENDEDLRIDLASELKNTLHEADRDSFDVVAFTHADDDHIHGATEFFHLEHAEKYQGDGRIKIEEMWVPAAMILEEGAQDEAKILIKEAKHRLRQGKGIRVFSRPDALKDWLEGEGLTLDSRKHLITRAGSLVPGFDDKTKTEIEFFVHSPLSKHCDEGEIDRNTGSLVMQGTFDTGNQILLSADTPNDVWQDIVSLTKSHKNEDRLKWDIKKLPHHCSYLSLAPEKGKDKTEPVEEAQWLLDQGQTRSTIVSTSDPIPSEDTDQPPHRQAHRTYKDHMAKLEGQIIVTMEHPTKSKPERLVIEVDGISGARIVKRISAPAVVITSKNIRNGNHA